MQSNIPPSVGDTLRKRCAGPSNLQIEWLPTAALRANPRNARTHSKKQLRQIAASIRTFGFINPVVVDESNVVLAGHGRLEAARAEGFPEIATVRLDNLTAAQKRAFVLADNKIAERAGWDRELLALELGELIDLLPAEGLDISLTGFETPEIDLVITALEEARHDPSDSIPSLPDNPVTRRQDLWQLGKHRLLCGDTRSIDDVSRLMGDERAAAVFADPPYNLRIKGIVGRGSIHHTEFAFASGEMSAKEFRLFLKETLGHAVEVSTSGALHYVCMDWRHIGDLIAVGQDLYDAMLNLCVWNKTNAGQGSFYRSQHELVGVFRVGPEPHQNNIELGRFGRNRSNSARLSDRPS